MPTIAGAYSARSILARAFERMLGALHESRKCAARRVLSNYQHLIARSNIVFFPS